MDTSKEINVESSGFPECLPVPNTDKTLGQPAIASIVTSMPAPRTHIAQRARRAPILDTSSLVPARRSSTRSIKRKKFDDELVESSLVKSERGKVKSGVPAPLTTQSPYSGHSTTAHTQTTTLAVVPSRIASTVAPSLPVNEASLPPGTSLVVKTDEVTLPVEPTRLVPIPVVRPPVEKKSKVTSGKGHCSKPASSKSTSGKSIQSKGSGKTAGRSGGQSKSKSKSKRSRKQKNPAPALKDLGRWKPQDDIALITAVQQTNDLSAVHVGVKFTCRFTLKEVEERWYALLYDQAISKNAMEAARQLHSDTVATIQGKALYSVAEEKLLGTYKAASQPTVESFQSLLHQHPDVFHPARTAKTLHSHWLLMKQYHLLPDQNVQPMPKGDHILNLSDIEDFMNDDDLQQEENEIVEKELSLVDRRNKREIRHLEQEMPKWQVLVDSVTGISMPDFDSQTLGVLRGRLVRYLMRSREISLGRSTKDNRVDVDLSLEGPSWKISRRQGLIKLRNSGDFFIANEGKRAIMVDGKPVMSGSKQKLNNNSVIEISSLRFTFLINQDVINGIRADVTKTVTPTPTHVTVS